MAKQVGVALAAGKGVRMKSELPKVLHEIAGMPVLFFVIEAMKQADVTDLFIVVGNGKDLVKERFADAGVSFVDQDEQLGTGHAVMMARPAFEKHTGSVVVVNGDNPLLRPETIRAAVALREQANVSCVVVTAEVANPTGYGRVIRKSGGLVERIVEERDCTDEERAVTEINSGNYIFKAPDLLSALERLSTENDQREYLLTDVVKHLNEQGLAVEGLKAKDPTEVLGINSRRQLAESGRIMSRRINEHWMEEGVALVDPATTYIDPRASIGADSVIEPCVVIRGPVVIGRGCHVRPFVELVGPLEIADGKTVTVSSGQPVVGGDHG